MDTWSDLDIGWVFDSESSRQAAWDERWNWDIAPWFHRFDADHIKPHFVIYLFKPCVKADINLYVDDLPSWKGAPFLSVYDTTDRLEQWAKDRNTEFGEKGARIDPPSRETLDHEDERIWAWIVYCVQHVQRGEHDSVLAEFYDIRHILERWSALLLGEPFSVRRIESRWPADIVENLSKSFTSASRDSLKQLLIHTIDVHSRHRAQIGKKFDMTWTTTEDAMIHVRKLVERI